MSWFRNETLQGGLILAGLLLIFFSTPLLHSRDSYYSGADLIQGFTLTSVDPEHSGNTILTDTVYAMQPWQIFDRESFRAGKIPLWNPYNGNGTPQLANYQSAVFSPFSLPYYLLTMRMGLVVSPFLKLFAAGFFTFLFLKQIKARQFPALVGGTAFMFCGYNLTFLGWPHSGVTFSLPATLYFVEWVFSRYEQSLLVENKTGSGVSWRDYFGGLAGLSLSVGAGLLAGHPETFYFAMLPFSAYVLFRLLNLWFKQRGGWATVLKLGKLVGQVGAAFLVGVGMAAVQLLPFLEYYLNGFQLTAREESIAGSAAFSTDTWGFFFLPNLLGMGSEALGSVGLKYVETNSLHIGGLILFLALMSLWFIGRDKFIAFFGGAFILWVIYGYNILGLATWFRLVPGITMVSVGRCQVIGLFSLSCCAALFLERLYKRKNFAPVTSGNWAEATPQAKSLLKSKQYLALPLTSALVGLGMLAFAFDSSRGFLERHFAQLQPETKNFLPDLPGQVWIFGLTFGGGLLAVVMLGFVRNLALRAILGGGLVLMVFIQNGYLLKDYYPTIPDRFFYPVTASIKQLQETVKNQRLVIVGWNTIPSDVNTIYKMPMPHSYDALYIKYYNQLATKVFGNQTLIFSLLRADERVLQLFGVDYYMAGRGDFKLDMSNVDSQFTAHQLAPSTEILPEREISQSFRPVGDDLWQVVAFLQPFNRTNKCTLKASLQEVATSRLITEQSFPCQSFQGDQPAPLKLTFPPVAEAQGKEFRLILSSADSQPGNALAVWVKPDLVYPDGQLSSGGQIQPGGLAFDFYSGNRQNFEKITNFAVHTLYRYKNSLSKYYTVGQGLVVDSDAQALDLATRREFQPSQNILLTKAEAARLSQPLLTQTSSPTEKAESAKVLAEDDTAVRLRVSRKQPGYLVLTNAWYPGWKAKVNGVEKPVLRANYAFQALEVPAGDSQIEVYYDPDSFRYGGLLSLICLGLIGGLAIVRLFWRRST